MNARTAETEGCCEAHSVSDGRQIFIYIQISREASMGEGEKKHTRKIRYKGIKTTLNSPLYFKIIYAQFLKTPILIHLYKHNSMSFTPVKPQVSTGSENIMFLKRPGLHCISQCKLCAENILNIF